MAKSDATSGLPASERWFALAAGVLLAGPMVCGTSQAVNDWYDRHVDAINEPDRPIPSGRMPGKWGLYVAIIWTGLSLALATPSVIHTHWIDGNAYARVLADNELPKVVAFAQKHLRMKIIRTTGE